MRFIVLVMLSFNCLADLQSITSKGGSKYSVVIGGEVLSSHSSQHKAIEKAVQLLEADCVGVCQASVTQTFELVILVAKKSKDDLLLTGVELSWSIPIERKDGSPLLQSDIVRYEIEMNGEVAFTAEPNQTSVAFELLPGSYVFRIRTVAESEGEYSSDISIAF